MASRFRPPRVHTCPMFLCPLNARHGRATPDLLLGGQHISRGFLLYFLWKWSTFPAFAVSLDFFSVKRMLNTFAHYCFVVFVFS